MPKTISSKTLRNVKNRLPAFIWAALIFVFSTDAFSAGNTAAFSNLHYDIFSRPYPTIIFR